MIDPTELTTERLPVPYSSPEARTYAAEDIFRGEQSLHHPELFKKDDATCSLSDLLFEIGRASGRERNELRDAHDAIPENLAPRKDGTLGEKPPLAERIAVLLAIISRQSAEVEALRVALAPFAKLADSYEPDARKLEVFDDEYAIYDPPKVGDLRAARAIYKNETR